MTRARNAGSPGNLLIGHGLRAFVQVVTAKNACMTSCACFDFGSDDAEFDDPRAKEGDSKTK